MSKFAFEAKFVVNATSIEDALAAIADHISTVNRRAASGDVSIAECGAEFSIKQADDGAKVVDLTDKVSQSIGLDLDPKSPAGIAHAERIKHEESERSARKRANLNEGKTDAEVMAEHSKKEQRAAL